MNLRKSVEEWKQEVIKKKNIILQELQTYIPIIKLQETSVPSWNAIFYGEGKDKSYCVKVMNEESILVDWKISDLDYIGKIMSNLQNNGLSCIAPPIPLEEGLYASRFAGYAVVVFPWYHVSEQNQPKNNKADVDSFIFVASPTLCELHLKGKIIPDKLKQESTSFPRKYGPFLWANMATNIWEQCEKNMTQIGASKEVILTIHKARENSSEIVDKFPEFFSSLEEEKTIVHGDFRPENIIIENNSVQLIHDFDFTRIGIAEEDVAYTALYCSGTDWFTGSHDWKICANAIKTYQRNAKEKGHKGIKTKLLEAALYWTCLKELSLSFNPEETLGRYKLFKELKNNTNWILASC